jgi:hypothetical protein
MAIQQLQKDSKISECIDNCSEAAQACEVCADACAEEGEEMARCLRLCRDVADLTSLHARFMSRESEFHAGLAELCVEACEACRDECEQHDMDHCQTCVEVLEPCIESCREMAA